MPTEPDQSAQAPEEAGEKQLCVGCMFPNATAAHFCAKCGAPLTSYAATGPFESLFAEGHIYRQAAERPRSMIVVLGVWLIFGTIALAGLVVAFMGREMGIGYTAFGALMLALSGMVIWKTTRNYWAREKVDDKQDD